MRRLFAGSVPGHRVADGTAKRPESLCLMPPSGRRVPPPPRTLLPGPGSYGLIRQSAWLSYPSAFSLAQGVCAGCYQALLPCLQRWRRPGNRTSPREPKTCSEKTPALAKTLESAATEADELLNFCWWKQESVSELLSSLAVELEGEQASIIRDGIASPPISAPFKVKATLRPDLVLELPQTLHIAPEELRLL